MTPRLNLLGGDTLVVSPTQLEELRTCPRRWMYRYLYRRVRAGANAAANGGKAFDLAINHRYKKLGHRAVDPATEAEMLALVDQQFEGVELPLEEYRTPSRYKEVVQDYNSFWREEAFRVLGVQVPFAVEIGSMRVVVHGILDLFVQVAGHTFIVDTKTSNSGREGAYENSAQMKCYMWALTHLAALHPDRGLPSKVHGCFINECVIRPPYKSANRTAKSTDRLRNEFHRTMPAFYTPERLEEWRQDTLLWVETALTWVTRDHFPQNEKVCPLHYGAKCAFLDVCTLPTEQREMALATDQFVDYERGPLAGMEPSVTAPI
jgi:hypothetical protein